MNIYVGNLDYNIDEYDLRGIFEDYGNVENVSIIKDKYTGKSKGYGFVTMNNISEGKKAIEDLNGAQLENREMVVNESRKKKKF